MTRAELEVIDARLAMEEEVRRDRYPTLLGLLYVLEPAARARMAEEAMGIADGLEIMGQDNHEVRAAVYRAIATDLRRDY